MVEAIQYDPENYATSRNDLRLVRKGLFLRKQRILDHSIPLSIGRVRVVPHQVYHDLENRNMKILHNSYFIIRKYL